MARGNYNYWQVGAESRPNYKDLIEKAKLQKKQEVEQGDNSGKVKIDEKKLREEAMSMKDMSDFKNKVPFDEKT